MKIFYLLLLIPLMFLFTGAVPNQFPSAAFNNQNTNSNNKPTTKITFIKNLKLKKENC